MTEENCGSENARKAAWIFGDKFHCHVRGVTYLPREDTILKQHRWRAGFHSERIRDGVVILVNSNNVVEKSSAN